MFMLTWDNREFIGAFNLSAETLDKAVEESLEIMADWDFGDILDEDDMENFQPKIIEVKQELDISNRFNDLDKVLMHRRMEIQKQQQEMRDRQDKETYERLKKKFDK